MGDDRLHLRRATGARHHDLVSRANGARPERAGEAAEVEVRPVHPLHGHAERPGLQVVGYLDRLQVLLQRRPVIPGRLRRPLHDVVAEAGRDRDRLQRLESEPFGERPVCGDDALEGILGMVDQIHLVDRQHDVADAQQRHQERVPLRLRQYAVARVDEDHRQLGVGGAGRHVAGILLVAGRVGDDELACLGGEEAVGDVDGDALFALRLQPVDEEGEVDVVADGAVPAAVAGERRQLVLKDQLGIVEQPTDQRRLAVVDRSAGDEAQQTLGGLLGEILGRERRRCGHVVHQK